MKYGDKIKITYLDGTTIIGKYECVDEQGGRIGEEILCINDDECIPFADIKEIKME